MEIRIFMKLQEKYIQRKRIMRFTSVTFPSHFHISQRGNTQKTNFQFSTELAKCSLLL